MNNFTTIPDLHELFLAANQKITTDTRKIEKGAIFFALKGDNFDANNFAEKALEAGCSYAVVDNAAVVKGGNYLLVPDVLTALQDLAKYHRTKLNIPVIGITGSNGKTTNKELMNAVLSKKYKTFATKGNLNNHIGVPLSLLSITSEHEMAIIEMGANHQGEIAMLSEISMPNYGLITNIGKAHLEGFGGIEGVKKGKSELYKYINKTAGKVFLNGDDSVLIELAKNMDKVTFGENPDNDIYGVLIPDTEYVSFKWGKRGENLSNKQTVKTNMFGHYNFINLLCAACIGKYFNVDEEKINEALSEYVPEMNRSQVKKTNKNTLILDAYNANPSSMGLAIDNFLNQELSNKVLILGEMLELGEYSKQEHQKILDKLNSNNKVDIYLVGKGFMDLKDGYSSFKFFNNTNELKNELSAKQLTNKTVLIKGSRGVKLEDVVEFL